jgi:hypothetical protein
VAIWSRICSAVVESAKDRCKEKSLQRKMVERMLGGTDGSLRGESTMIARTMRVELDS